MSLPPPSIKSGNTPVVLYSKGNSLGSLVSNHLEAVSNSHRSNPTFSSSSSSSSSTALFFPEGGVGVKLMSVNVIGGNGVEFA